jgi:hypothetical protein
VKQTPHDKSKQKKMEHNSRGNKIVTMTTVVAQSPSVTGSKELTTNQTKSNPSITWWKMKSFCQAKFVLLKLLLHPEIERNSKP